MQYPTHGAEAARATVGLAFIRMTIPHLNNLNLPKRLFNPHSSTSVYLIGLSYVLPYIETQPFRKFNKITKNKIFFDLTF